MEGPIIACDISKGSSHIQGFNDFNKPLSKSIKIVHDNEGFNKLKSLKDEIYSITNKIPSFVFEYTGIYQIPIIEKAKSLGMILYGISPLESAKIRKSYIRTTKTDKRDTKNIAGVYYSRTIRKYSSVDNNLAIKCRFRDTLIKKRSNAKNTVSKYMDIVFPLYLDYFCSFYNESSIYVIKHFRCINVLKRRSINEITKTLENKTCHRGMNCKSIALKLKEYSTKVSSCVGEDSSYIDALIDSLDYVIFLSDKIRILEDSIVKDALNLECYKYYKSIPGVSNILAANLSAELNDLSSFASVKQLIAYCGLDPSIQQSGNISGEHLQITKKGNKRVRRILYLVVSCMCRCNFDNQIVSFFNKRKSSGLCYKAAAIASSRKLLSCIFGMFTTKTLFRAF